MCFCLVVWALVAMLLCHVTSHGPGGDVKRLADGHVTGLAGCGSTLLQGSGEGNTKLSSDLSVRGAAKDELTH